MMDLAAVILVGGKSSRMGTNKALLSFNGKTFLEHLIEQVKPLRIPIYLSGNQDWIRDFRLPTIPDQIPDQGPVVALRSCFDHLPAKRVLVISCDVPELQTEDIERLLNTHQDDVDVTMFRSGNKDLPLVAVYNQSAYPHFAEAMDGGIRRLFSVIERLKTQLINYTGTLTNINTSEDLKAIQ